MSRVYLDASAIIYFVEAEALFHAAAVQSVGRFRGDPESRLVTSRLSRLECRVKPVRDSNKELLAKYDAFFKRRRLIVGDVTAAVIERAVQPICGFGIGFGPRMRFTSPRPLRNMQTFS